MMLTDETMEFLKKWSVDDDDDDEGFKAGFGWKLRDDAPEDVRKEFEEIKAMCLAWHEEFLAAQE